MGEIVKIADLQQGQCLLVDARKVKNGMIQLQFAEKLVTKDRPVSALTILNASDPRFSSGARRAWVSANILDASEKFDINFGDDGDWYSDPKGEIMDLNILNPFVEVNDSKYFFRVKVSETITANEWQAENLDRAAKRRGKNGDYITHEGDYIFSNTTVDVVPEGADVKHTFLEADAQGIAVDTTVEVESLDSIEL
jgi:hypothetical protein